MSEVIQPAAGQTVITTDNHNGRHHGHDNHFHETRLDADYRSLSAQAERYGVATGDRINTVGSAGALASGRTDQLVGSGFGGVHDRICDSTGKVIGSVDRGFTAAALAACKTDDTIAALYAATQKQVSDSATSTLVGFKDLTALSYQIQGQALLEAAKNAAAITVQATANANASSVEATKNFYALSVEAVKNASAAELRAQQIASAAAAQAAECCCELKALIVSDGNATRSLINTNTVEQLRAQLVATQRLIPVTIPVGAG